MNIEEFYSYCITKNGTKEEFPFDNDILTFKVGDKIFALTSLISWEEGNGRINLKCDPEYALELRAKFEGIVPGYHMNKKHWNTIIVNTDVTDQIIKELIDHSYECILKNLPKKIREGL